MDRIIVKAFAEALRERPLDAKIYLNMAEKYLEINPFLTYLCLENALFYSDDISERENIASVLSELLKSEIYVRPVSIIILSYNTLEYTKKCIDSIRRTTPITAREIIVVDNASTDGSVEYLKNQSDVKLIINDENKGFPAGCNQGIIASDPNSDVLLLNSDTVLLPNALFYLRMGLYKKDNYGTAGCITNRICNMQAVPELYNIDITNEDGYTYVYKYGLNHNVPMKNAYEEKIYLTGFALLIKRNVINEVGMLDEIFTPGNYEDNDYGLRVLAAGYKNILCHNSFIMHVCSASFNKKPEEFRNILLSNCETIKEKIGFNIDYYTIPRTELINMIDKPYDSYINVLELGCGMGATLSKIKYLYPNSYVCGIEIVDKVAYYANLLNPVKCADVETMEWDYEDNSFDYVIMGDILEHLRDPWSILNKVNKLVKTGGKIIISMPNVLHYSVILPLIIKGEFHYSDAGILDTTHLKMWTKKEIVSLVEDSGFTIENISYSSFTKPTEKEEEIIKKLVEISETVKYEEYMAYQWILLACKRV